MKLDEGSKKGIYFSIGALMCVLSVINFEQYQILAIFGILIGMFFIVKALN